MSHSTQLQNWLPAAALDNKTPYEARHNKKPCLAGIQEFGAAAYVKDLKSESQMLEQKLVDSLVIIQNPRDIGSIGQERDQ